LGDTTIELTETGSTGEYTTAEPISQGVYAIYVDDADTGRTLTLSTENDSAALDCFTVNFAVEDDEEGTSLLSEISAKYGGVDVTSGTVVLGGKALVITAVGKGAESYTYAWDDEAETEGAILTIEELDDAVDVTCTVFGVGEDESTADIAPKLDAGVLTPVFSVKKGKFFNLYDVMIIEPGRGNSVEFISSNPSVVSVLPDGKVTGEAKGTVIIAIRIYNAGGTVLYLEALVMCN